MPRQIKFIIILKHGRWQSELSLKTQNSPRQLAIATWDSRKFRSSGWNEQWEMLILLQAIYTSIHISDFMFSPRVKTSDLAALLSIKTQPQTAETTCIFVVWFGFSSLTRWQITAMHCQRFVCGWVQFIKGDLVKSL